MRGARARRPPLRLPREDRVAFTFGRGFVAVAPVGGGAARKLGAGTAVAWAPSRVLAVARQGSIAVLGPDGKPLRTTRALGFGDR